MLDVAIKFNSQWKSQMPTQVLFGNGSLDKLGQICSEFGKDVLIICGGFVTKIDLLNRCFDLLSNENIQGYDYVIIDTEPTIHQVNNIVKLINQNKFRVLVAIGGGSVLDAAKAAAVIAAQGGFAEEYLTNKRSISSSSLPVIAVPTTAGTGAELSKGAILTWPERQIKGGIRGNAVFSNVAIVDPTLTLSLSQEYIKITGFDVFAHAIETYISRKATPITTLFSHETVIAVCHFLPLAIKNPQDLYARTQLSFYSMLMGYNLANSSTCLPHRLQYPIGSLTNTPHALGLAAIYPTWIKTSYRASQRSFVDVVSWIAHGMNKSIPKIEEDITIVKFIRDFMNEIELTPTLGDLGVDGDLCKKMTDMVSGNLENDPWWDEHKKDVDLLKIYLDALD
jgi:alcohol dehydrogenase class IV